MIYAEQSGGMESLRAYARWLDHRDHLPEFERPPEENYYKHPAMGLECERFLSCPQLVGHDCFSGYFLPCEFERLAQVEPYLIFGHWPASRSAGSSLRLRRELAFVADHLFPESDNAPEDDPLVKVRAAFLQFKEAAELSCQHGLPIIFWG